MDNNTSNKDFVKELQDKLLVFMYTAISSKNFNQNDFVESVYKIASKLYIALNKKKQRPLHSRCNLHKSLYTKCYELSEVKYSIQLS